MKTALKRLICASVVTGAALCAGPSFGQILNSTDQVTIFNNYNNGFYSATGGNAIYVEDTNRVVPTEDAYFWQSVEEIEMAEDAYETTGQSGYQGVISALCNGFTSINGSSWSNNIYNDDICWATIAFTRAYLDTGNSSYYNTALSNYNMMYARAYDTNLGGGLWWNTSDGSKNACVEGPGAIAAMMLYKCGAGTTYLTDAEGLFNWEETHLYNASTGAISDNESSAGVVQGGPTTYNQGTFIGAADLIDVALGNKNDDGYADTVAKYTMNSMVGTNQAQILTDEYPIGGGTSNNAGFDGIFARWCCKWVKDSGHTEFNPWLQLNALTAWNDQNTAGLSWGHWGLATVNGYLGSWECSDSVAIIEDAALPAPVTTLAGMYNITSVQSGLAIDSAAGTQNTLVELNSSTKSASQTWTLATSGSGYSVISKASGLALDGGANVSTTHPQLYGSNGTVDQQWQFYLSTGGYGIISVQSGLALDGGPNTAGGNPQMWAPNFTPDQQWILTVSTNCLTTPSAPATPTASGTTSTSTNLSWSAVGAPTNCSITGFEVYKNGTAMASTTSTSYAVSGLSAGTAYTFTVAAIDAAGTGSVSGGVNVTTTTASCTTKPGAPSTPTASGTTSTSTNLSWGAVTPPANCTITGYEVYKNGTALASTSTTTYGVTGLTAGTAYTFTVAAIDSDGTGTVSSGVNVTTTAACSAKPGAPATPTASGTTSTTTNLSWTAVTPPANCSISGYEVYKNGTALASTSSTTYGVTGLTASTAYTFTVAAIDAAGTGTVSAGVNVTTSSGSICTGVAAWSGNSVSYAVGNLVTYNGSEYKCIQAHTSEAGWDPPAVPALWSLVGSC